MSVLETGNITEVINPNQTFLLQNDKENCKGFNKRTKKNYLRVKKKERLY